MVDQLTPTEQSSLTVLLRPDAASSGVEDDERQCKNPYLGSIWIAAGVCVKPVSRRRRGETVDLVFGESPSVPADVDEDCGDVAAPSFDESNESCIAVTPTAH